LIYLEEKKTYIASCQYVVLNASANHDVKIVPISIYLLVKKSSFITFPAHWCLAPLISRIYESLKSENRLRIKMGKFGCTRLRTSSSCTSERNEYFGSLFSGVRNIFLRGLICLLTKMAKKWGRFLATYVTCLAKLWGYRVFCSNVFLALLIDQHFIGIEFLGGLPKNHQDPTNRCRVI